MQKPEAGANLPREDGRGRQKCVHCDRRSIAGQYKGQGLCPYHYTAYLWGQQWADQCYAKDDGREGYPPCARCGRLTHETAEHGEGG